MERTNLRPSTIRIIQTDYLAMVATLAPIVFLIAYIAISYFGFLPGLRGHDPIRKEEGAPFFLYGTIVTLLAGVPVMLWRVQSVKKTFANGVEVPGQITGVRFYRDRGRVEFTYSYQGQIFSGGSAVMKTRRTEGLAPGIEAVLVVDKNNPKRALIRDLYI